MLHPPGGSDDAQAPEEWLVLEDVAYRRVVLCFLVRPGPGGHEVLLGLKRTGFGAGRLVALGGKIDGPESALDAAVREVEEESGIRLVPAAVREAGRISWSFPAHPAWNMAATLFTADDVGQPPAASDEIDPRWYAVDDLPWPDMWKDAPHWIPAVLAGRRVDAHIVMADDDEHVASAVHR
ncbi:8-oxo-dGTP diphosphatase [Arthrobacter agilis]|uniref:8-oxo-dGTP diphosphatase n=1 Tax=Arthrobacter agilis TaxID=37921 RepID=UPI0014776650|nr:8-oxo-dGTP diphosphatase [Arthrobacter agilis]